MVWFASLVWLLLVYGCGAKLSTANAQYERGEYFAAAATYRKVYNKTPAKERAKRGQIAFRIGECHRRLNAAPRSAAGYPECRALQLPRQHGALLPGPGPADAG